MLLALLLAPDAFAQTEATDGWMVLPEEYTQMLQQLPQALKDSLPEQVLKTDAHSAAQAWESLTSPKAILSLVGDHLSARWQQYLALLLQLVGVVLLRAVWNTFAAGLSSSTLTGGMHFLCRLVLFGIIFSQAMLVLEGVKTFFDDLGALTGAFLPLMGAMYAMGGNVGAAVANQSTLLLTFSLVEWVGGKSVVPLFSLCLGFALLGAFESTVSGRMQLLTGKLKKWYTTALALVMLLLSSVLAAQTTLSARADSLGFRTVRFAVSAGIPLVGGGVADMLRTASVGLSWLRGIVGIGGMVLLLYLLLPQILSLWLARLVFSLTADVAVWLGCGEEQKLLCEVQSLYGYLLAVISVCVLTFFFALVLLLKCGAAYA